MNSLESKMLGRQTEDVGVSALELLLNVTLPLILILAIEIVVNRKVQAKVIERFEGQMDQHGFRTIGQLVDESQKQRLIHRIELVLKGREEALCLPAFPVIDDANAPTLTAQFAVDQDGFARDPRFRQLCEESQRMFQKQATDDLTRAVYVAALEVVIDGKTMYDSTYRPAPQPAGADTDVVTTENRKFGIELIRGRVLEFRDRVARVQLMALSGVLLAQNTNVVENEFSADEQRVVRARILTAFANRKLPLLESVVAE